MLTVSGRRGARSWHLREAGQTTIGGYAGADPLPGGNPQTRRHKDVTPGQKRPGPHSAWWLHIRHRREWNVRSNEAVANTTLLREFNWFRVTILTNNGY